MSAKDFTVGQKLWYVPRARRLADRAEGYEVVVKSVGRKWVTAGKEGRSWEDEKFAPPLMSADSEFSSPGSFYLSRDEYESTILVKERWNKLQSIVCSRVLAPKHLTLTQIEETISLIEGKV